MNASFYGGQKKGGQKGTSMEHAVNTDYDPLASVQAAGPPGAISFIYGLPDPDTFSVKELSAAFDEVLQERPALALQYGPEQGYGPLIDYLREKLDRDEGLGLTRANLIITGGASQAIDHICTLFTQSGDIVLTETPSYSETLQLFRDHGLRLLQIPTDEGGLQVEALRKRLEHLVQCGEHPRMLYVVPCYQNPTGITLVADRREAVLELADRYDLLVVEDDVYRDLAFDSPPPPSLYALDEHSRVLRVGSVSKLLSPALRLGWAMGPPKLIDRMIGSGLRCMGGGANPLTANAVATYCQHGLLEPHIEQLRRVYRARRDSMLKALETHMPDDVHWTRPNGGFFVWLSLPRPFRAIEVIKRTQQAGVMALAGDPFFAERPTGQFLRLAFSYVTHTKIAEGIETLADVLVTGC